MCGILYWNNATDEGVYHLSKIAHRGNRKPKFVIEDGQFFGHTRLAIQGTANSEYDQPYISESEILLYNGEVFNFRELDSKLECDTPLFMNQPHISKFDGFFAYVKYNTSNKHMQVCSDKYGKKPLYYKLNGKTIVGISSEIKGLVTPEDELDTGYLSRVAKFGYNFGNDKTIVKSIHRFMPGLVYSILKGEIVGKRNIPNITSELCKDPSLYNRIDLSVSRRLISDIPVSILLSGGIDSSIIMHHVTQHQDNVKVFSIENETDMEYVEHLEGLWGFTAEKIKLDTYDKDKIYMNDESAVDLGSVIPQYLLFEKIKKKGYNVALSGDAADELFCGYKRNEWFDHRESDINDELPYYHFPRLDRASMNSTVELRSPFAAEYVINFAKTIPYEESINKSYLRKVYKSVLPKKILERKKEPLKIKEIREDPLEARKNLINFWLNNFGKFTGKEVGR